MKIPHKLKGTGIASGHYVVFAPLLKCGPVFKALERRDNTIGIPAMGKITVKGKSYFFCRYGFVNDDDIYTRKPKTSKP
jgi:hypothetical protein